MINTEIVIGFAGAATTIIGAILGNIQGRKKSNAEAGLMQIQTLEEIRKFYQTTIASQSEIVAKRDDRISMLENELNIYKQKVDMLQQVVSRLLNKTVNGPDEKLLFTHQEVLDMLNFDNYVRKTDSTAIKKDE